MTIHTRRTKYLNAKRHPLIIKATCGLDDQGMPFGIQILGAPGMDRHVLEVAASLERVLAANPATARPIPDIKKL